MLETCLTGTRVIDFSQWLPGPFATQILADFGADVLKVEPPAGDPLRAFGPKRADGVSAFYAATNAGKRVLQLDLKSAAGADTFRRLLSRSDVLLESFRPGTLDRLGFSQPELALANPGLVRTSLSGWGQNGPYAHRAGHDINYLAVGGGLHYSGTAARPATSHTPVADFASALTAVIATLCALLRRRTTGEGAFIDVSIMESVLAWQTETVISALWGGMVGRGIGLLGGGAANYNVYRTADGMFVTLGALEPKFWQAFCRRVGRPDWIERQADPLPQQELIAEVQAMFGSQPRTYWQSLLDPEDCCFEAVLTVEEMLAHPQVTARGLLQVASDRIEALFPAFFCGLPRRPRPPFIETAEEQALNTWGA